MKIRNASLAGLALAAALFGAACAAPATADPAVTTSQAVMTAVAQPPSAAIGAITADGARSPAALGATSFAVVAEATEARYRVTEQIAGNDLPNDAVGATSAVSGAIVIDADGRVVPDASKITVDLTTLASDNSRRDGFVKQSTLQTGQFPTATFVPTAVEGLPTPLPTSGAVSFALVGDLTVHGVTWPVTWQVEALADEAAVAGTATTTVTFAQFGMTAPKVGPVLSVDEELALEIDFEVARAA
jgi:polyisoprenoid-binding protein YceI